MPVPPRSSPIWPWPGLPLLLMTSPAGATPVVPDAPASPGLIGLCLGVLLSLSLQHLLVGMVRRTQPQPVAVLFTAGLAVLTLAQSGWGPGLLWPETPSWHRLVIIAGLVMAGLSGTRLTLRCVEAARHSPSAERAVLPAGLAWGALILGAGLWGLHSLGALPDLFWTRHAWPLAAATGAVLLSAALVLSEQPPSSTADTPERIDALTGLPNAHLLGERLEKALPRAERLDREVVVLRVDLTGLDSIVERLGPAAGNAIVRTVARRMQQRLRQTDTLARLEGADFAVLLDDVEPGAVLTRVIDNLGAEIARPCEWQGEALSVSGRFGMARFPADAEQADLLLRQAAARRQAPAD
jgi:diguanylate cyclase (GGDEF)-like protein